jgi:hypothetical protein
MPNIDDTKVDIIKIGKICIFLFLIFFVVALLFPEIFGAKAVIDLAVAAILIIGLIAIVAFVTNKLISGIEYKEIEFKKSGEKLPPMIFYLSLILGIICIALATRGLLAGEFTIPQRYTSRGILVTRDVNTGTYWLAIIAFGFAGVVLIIYPIVNKIKCRSVNKDT